MLQQCVTLLVSSYMGVRVIPLHTLSYYSSLNHENDSILSFTYWLTQICIIILQHDYNCYGLHQHLGGLIDEAEKTLMLSDYIKIINFIYLHVTSIYSGPVHIVCWIKHKCLPFTLECLLFCLFMCGSCLNIRLEKRYEMKVNFSWGQNILILYFSLL